MIQTYLSPLALYSPISDFLFSHIFSRSLFQLLISLKPCFDTVEQIHPPCAYQKATSRQKQVSNIIWFMSCQQILPCYCYSTSIHLKKSKQTQLRVCKIIFIEAFCEHPKKECTGKPTGDIRCSHTYNRMVILQISCSLPSKYGV